MNGAKKPEQNASPRVAGTQPPVAASPSGAPSKARLTSPWHALIILTLCYALAFTDRQILNLMVDPMKRDFGVTDKQIGFLLGPAFTITYVSLGLFAGYCADRMNRRNILLIAGMIWSMATLAAAFAVNYETMVATRLLVGASEAFLFPSGMSLVAELFDRRRLPTATTIFLTAPYIGGGFALIAGGLVLGQTAGMAPIVLPFGIMRDWQVAIALVGIFGGLAIMLLGLIAEPARGDQADMAEDMRQFSFMEGTAYLLARWRFFIMFFLGLSLVTVLLNAVPAWAPTMFTRQYGVNPQSVGVVYGFLVLGMGVLAGLSSPMINRLIARRYTVSTMRTVLIGPVVLLGLGAALMVIVSPSFAFLCIALITFAYVLPLPMAGVSLQLATPPRLRGLASAYYFVLTSVIAVGLGPLMVPMAADYILHDENNLNTALGIVILACAAPALLFLRVALAGFRQIIAQNEETDATA